jgi:hypothetical protein
MDSTDQQLRVAEFWDTGYPFRNRRFSSYLRSGPYTPSASDSDLKAYLSPRSAPYCTSSRTMPTSALALPRLSRHTYNLKALSHSACVRVRWCVCVCVCGGVPFSFLSILLQGKINCTLSMEGDDLQIDFHEFDQVSGKLRSRSFTQLSGGQRRCAELAFSPVRTASLSPSLCHSSSRSSSFFSFSSSFTCAWGATVCVERDGVQSQRRTHSLPNRRRDDHPPRPGHQGTLACVRVRGPCVRRAHSFHSLFFIPINFHIKCCGVLCVSRWCARCCDAWARRRCW